MSKKQCDRLKFFSKDEQEATEDYLKWSKKVKDPKEKKMFKQMSKDEAKHKKNIDKMLKSRDC